MWKFVSAGDSHGDPLLHTLNNNQGRQTWEFDAKAGSPELIERAEELRAHFAANRHTQKHSSDELLRLQCRDKIAQKKHSPPSTPLGDEEVRQPIAGGAAPPAGRHRVPLPGST